MEGRRRVLFLDVDGVLMLFHRRGEWNERCLLQLKRVLTELHPVEIVLSSNWKRSEESMQELVAQFKRLSFPGWEEASVTDLQVTPELEYETSVAHSRVREIVEWLRRAKEEKSLVPPHSGASLSDIAWVAVDDMNLEEADGNVMKGHFVRTGREEGLSLGSSYNSNINKKPLLQQ
ncbi:Polynucleotide kinase [Balamuthia mandrillaris]